jgi:hypothetical protein
MAQEYLLVFVTFFLCCTCHKFPCVCVQPTSFSLSCTYQISNMSTVSTTANTTTITIATVLYTVQFYRGLAPLLWPFHLYFYTFVHFRAVQHFPSLIQKQTTYCTLVLCPIFLFQTVTCIYTISEN